MQITEAVLCTLLLLDRHGESGRPRHGLAVVPAGEYVKRDAFFAPRLSWRFRRYGSR